LFCGLQFSDEASMVRQTLLLLLVDLLDLLVLLDLLQVLLVIRLVGLKENLS